MKLSFYGINLKSEYLNNACQNCWNTYLIFQNDAKFTPPPQHSVDLKLFMFFELKNYKGKGGSTILMSS